MFTYQTVPSLLQMHMFFVLSTVDPMLNRFKRGGPPDPLYLQNGNLASLMPAHQER